MVSDQVVLNSAVFLSELKWIGSKCCHCECTLTFQHTSTQTHGQLNQKAKNSKHLKSNYVSDLKYRNLYRVKYGINVNVKCTD